MCLYYNLQWVTSLGHVSHTLWHSQYVYTSPFHIMFIPIILFLYAQMFTPYACALNLLYFWWPSLNLLCTLKWVCYSHCLSTTNTVLKLYYPFAHSLFYTCTYVQSIQTYPFMHFRVPIYDYTTLAQLSRYSDNYWTSMNKSRPLSLTETNQHSAYFAAFSSSYLSGVIYCN